MIGTNCDLCEKVFPEWRNKIKHLASFHKVFKCWKCDKNFESYSNLDAHDQKEHFGKQSWTNSDLVKATIEHNSMKMKLNQITKNPLKTT